MESYKAAALSTAHLTQNDVSELQKLAGSDPMIMERDTGVFIKLYCGSEEGMAANFRPQFSDELKRIIRVLLSRGYQMIEFDADAEESDDFPIHDW